MLNGRTKYIGLTGLILFLSCATTFAAPSEIRMSMDRGSLNQMLSHLHGAIFQNTWDKIPLRPTVALHVEHAEITSINQHVRTLDLTMKGKVEVRYHILEAEQHSAVGFTAHVQTKPITTPTSILLHVVDSEIQLEDVPIPGDIQIFPIDDLVRAVLLPEFIPLLNMEDLPKISVPIPGKTLVGVRPTTPRLRVGKDRLVLFLNLQTESIP